MYFFNDNNFKIFNLNLLKCALESVFSLARYFVAPEHPIIQISKHNFMVLLSKTADTVSLNDRWNIMNLLITLALFVGHRVTSDPDTFSLQVWNS